MDTYPSHEHERPSKYKYRKHRQMLLKIYGHDAIEEKLLRRLAISFGEQYNTAVNFSRKHANKRWTNSLLAKSIELIEDAILSGLTIRLSSAKKRTLREEIAIDLISPYTKKIAGVGIGNLITFKLSQLVALNNLSQRSAPVFKPQNYTDYRSIARESLDRQNTDELEAATGNAFEPLSTEEDDAEDFSEALDDLTLSPEPDEFPETDRIDSETCLKTLDHYLRTH